MSDKIYSRSHFIYEIKHIMDTHKLSETLTLKVLAKFHGISWEIDGSEMLALISKGLVKPDAKTVDEKKLFKGLKRAEVKQEKINFAEEPIGTEDTLKLADNLLNNFVPDEAITDVKIKEVADVYFYGNLGVAKYFIIFEYLFPHKDQKRNKKWNKHFGITYRDVSKWDKSGDIPKKFHKIYLSEDIGLFLSGLYYYMKDSIDLESFRVFAGKPRTFLANYTDWMDLAQTKLTAVKEAREEPEVSL